MDDRKDIKADFNIKDNICFIKVENKTFCLQLKKASSRLTVVKEFIPRIQEQLEALGYLPEKVYEFINLLYVKLREHGEATALLKKIFDTYEFEKVNQPYDDVYIIQSNSGEASIFLAYIAKALLARNKSKSPLFIASQPYLTDIIKMYFPDALILSTNLYYELMDQHLLTLGDSWFYNGHRFFLAFSQHHFGKVNDDIGKVHFIEQMLKTFDLTEADFSRPEPIIDSETKDNVLDKVKELGLDLNKFVIIAPDAMTYKLMPKKFWQILINDLKSQGYDVFLNTLKEHTYKNVKTAKLSLKEVFYLATLSKGVVTLRSGITDFLIPASVPIISLATEIPWTRKSTEEQTKAYTILKTPFIDKNLVHEIYVKQFTQMESTELTKEIIEILDELNT